MSGTCSGGFSIGTQITVVAPTNACLIQKPANRWSVGGFEASQTQLWCWQLTRQNAHCDTDPCAVFMNGEIQKATETRTVFTLISFRVVKILTLKSTGNESVVHFWSQPHVAHYSTLSQLHFSAPEMNITVLIKWYRHKTWQTWQKVDNETTETASQQMTNKWLSQANMDK